MEKKDYLRSLSSVNDLIQAVYRSRLMGSNAIPRELVTEASRTVLDGIREAILAARDEMALKEISTDTEELVSLVERVVEEKLQMSFRRVINATGMGKDTPGSPITWQGQFPRYGVAWEFNYRGELDFLHQAQAQAEARQLRVEDGWVYFVHGWAQVAAQVLHFELTPELFNRLERLAASVR